MLVSYHDPVSTIALHLYTLIVREAAIGGISHIIIYYLAYHWSQVYITCTAIARDDNIYDWSYC